MLDNYYILLGLHPDENDWAAIQERINECRLEWSRDSAGAGKQKIEATRKLELIRRITRDLRDDDKRREIRSEARRLLAALQNKMLEEINRFIGMVEDRSEVTEEFVTQIVKEVDKKIGGTISDSDVRNCVENCLKQRDIRVAGPKKAQQGRRLETLKPTEVREIQNLLAELGKTDLYDFLDKARNKKARELRERAQQVYSKANKTGKTDVKTTARKKLAGKCRYLFKDEKSKEQYDNTCAIQICEQLDGLLSVGGRDDRFLSRREVGKVMDEAVRLGIDQHVARRYIQDFAKKRKWHIQTTTETEDREQRERLTRQAVERSVPSDLRVSIMGGTARLRWRETGWHQSLAYVVVRGESRAPRHSKDGTVIAREVHADFYDDAEVPPGTSWYYGVFAVQGAFTSTRAATSGPHIHAAEPADVVARGTDRQVVVQWKPPRGCLSVEVWRKTGSPPSRRGEGTRVTASGKSATDHGLTNGRGYGYLVLASYRDQGRGGRIWSSGVRVEATPVSPPQPVDDLRVTRSGRDVILRWTPPGNGRVEIRRSKRIPGVSRGQVISAVQADHLGDRVMPTGNGEARTKLRGQDRVFFVPATFVEATGVVGKMVPLLQTGGRSARVTYQVVTERNWITRRVTGVRIDLRTEDDIGSLNGVAAVLNKTTVPMHLSDGRTVASRSRIEFQDGCATLALPGSVRAGYVKLFFEDDEARNGVRLLPPARNRLRIGSRKGG